MSPVVGTKATRATAKTSSVPSLHLPDADRSEAVAAAGSDRWRVSSRCGRIAGFVSSGNSSLSIILSPAVRIGDHRTPQVIIDRAFAARNPSSGSSSHDPGHPALIVSRSATWLLGLLLVYQLPSDMSEHLVYSD